MTSQNSAEASKKDDYSPSGWQIALGVLIVGTSAGLTLYTKKTQSMLQQMEKVRKSEAVRRGPPKFGPPTKAQWDKLRPRFDKDEFI